MKRCVVVFATPSRQWLWQVALQDDATVRDALEQARAQDPGLAVPWDGAVGIFGVLCDRDAVPADGDRIEVYRPLTADPKESRRARVTARRAARGRASSQSRA